MRPRKLLIDTNVIVDYLEHRQPHYEKARLLMIAGRVGDFDLWISSTQVTDLVFILSDGGKKKYMDQVLEKLRALRHFIHVAPVSSSDIDKMLATSWDDPEDALLFEIALRIQAEALITHDKDFPTSDLIPVHNCESFFGWLEEEYDVIYDEIPFP